MQSEGEEQSSESSSSGNRTSGFHSPNGWYLQELRYRNFWRKSHPALQPKDTWQVYEIEVPNTVVGLLIGVKGKTIQELSYRAHVIMTILPHNNPELTADYQVCQLRGERENINRALRFLRQRYPENRFPDLDLKRVVSAL
ncbi:unnamed protein product [Caenorhabditis auriculariae]|uniref:K Homology domain-containing protein n=1 Tax=Caenorhabditis auriculariae TaxID=2777116 RepID=A0A8S1H1D3_9PELO|nr:unnamed protein product [Caenorhabditis auriculariae]